MEKLAVNITLGCLILIECLFLNLTSDTKPHFVAQVQDLPKNTFYRVSKNNVKPMTVRIGAKISLEYDYAIGPGQFPTKVSIESTDAAMITENTYSYTTVTVGPPKLGGGTVGGIFTAVEVGQATITLTVESRNGTNTMRIEVTVQ